MGVWVWVWVCVGVCVCVWGGGSLVAWCVDWLVSVCVCASVGECVCVCVGGGGYARRRQRPWREFFASFDIPASEDVAPRVRANYFYFRANYTLVYAAAGAWTL